MPTKFCYLLFHTIHKVRLLPKKEAASTKELQSPNRLRPFFKRPTSFSLVFHAKSDFMTLINFDGVLTKILFVATSAIK